MNARTFETTTTTLVWELDLPTNWVEVEKTLAAIRQFVRDSCTDDSVIVTSGGDTLRFSLVIESYDTH